MSDLSLVGREDDGTSSVVDSQHTYTSLMPAPVRDRIVPCNSQSISSYLHAQPSTHGSSQASSYQGSRFSLLGRHRSRPNGRRKISSSSSSSTSRRTEEVIHRFKKLQICVAVLCVANVVTVAIFLLTHPKLSPFFSNDDDDFFTTGDGHLKTFKLCTMCQPLVAKVGFDRIIEDIRSEKYPKFCCFRRVDQLLKLFDGYAEQYVDDQVYKVRQEMNDNITKAKPVSRSIPQVMHVFYINTNGISDKTGPLTWETHGGDILLEGGLKMEQQQYLRIKKGGFYYIYNHLEMKAGATSSHYLMKNHNRNGQKKLMDRRNMGSNMISASEFQGVFQLKAGDTLAVFATEADILAGGRKNYFGAFILEK